MASQESERLRSCSTLNSGMEAVRGQLRGNLGSLDEQIRVTRLQYGTWLYVGVIEIVLVCPYLASQTALSVEAATEQLQAMQQELGLTGGVVAETPPVEGLQLIIFKVTLYCCLSG